MFVAEELDEAVTTLDQLRTRLDGRDFDNAWQLYYALTSALYIVSEPETSRDASNANLAELERAIGRPQITFSYYIMAAIASAASGDVDATRHRVSDAEADLLNSADDGLPDLLVPLAALAWALNAHELARRVHHRQLALFGGPAETSRVSQAAGASQCHAQVAGSDRQACPNGPKAHD